MENTCKNCKHWFDTWKDSDWDGRVIYDSINGDCKRLTENNYKKDKCRVYGDSDPITTEENFGCIHFEKK